MLRGLFAIAFLCVLGACATAPRNEALILADAGQAATNAVSGQILQLEAITDRAAFVGAAQLNYEHCETVIRLAQNNQRAARSRARTAQPTCDIVEPSEELRASRVALRAAIDLRRQALEAVGRSYNALRREAQYDAAADLQDAAGKAATAAGAALTSIAPTASPATPIISAAAQPLAGIFANAAQKRRLIEGSAGIGAAVRTLADVASIEGTLVFAPFSTTYAQREYDLRQVALRDGVLARPRALAPLAPMLGGALASDSDTRVNASPPWQAAAAAVDLELFRARMAMVPRSYVISSQLLTALADAHDDFSRGERANLARVQQLTQQLNSVVNSIAGAQAPPAAPPPATPPAAPATSPATPPATPGH